MPQRADYVHLMADLLCESFDSVHGKQIVGLDIGCGASCIYSLLGAREYGWSFLASDFDAVALANASEIVEKNGLQEQIQFRQQRNALRALRGVLKRHEELAFCMCNPPFHESLEHARRAAERKWQGLGKSKSEKNYQALEFKGDFESD